MCMYVGLCMYAEEGKIVRMEQVSIVNCIQSGKSMFYLYYFCFWQ